MQLRAPLICVASLVLSSWATAQAPIPDPHWGAYAFPSRTPELRAGLHLNRFTQFSSPTNQFNEIEETSGFNFFAGSYTDRIPAFPEFSITVSAGAGYSADEPTQTLQNDFVHELIEQGKVPVGDVREEPEFLGGLSVTRWIESETNLGRDLFVGGGVATSTLYHEPFLHAGGSLMLGDSCRLGLMHRTSWPVEGQAYTDLAPVTNLSQGYLAYVPSHIDSSLWLLDFLGNPEMGLTITRDSGLFKDPQNDPIDTWFVGLRFKWPTGLLFETWNDMANGTDFGPTYGFLLSADLLTLPGLGFLK